MDILKTTPEQLRSKAGEIDSAVNKIKSQTDKMFDIVNGINGAVWSGDAATAYKNQFEELRDDAERMKTLGTDLKERLIQIAQEYSSTEENVTSISQSLAKDIIQ